MLLTKELEILQTTSSKCLLEGKKHGKEEEEEEEERKKERKKKKKEKIEFRTCRRKGKKQ